MRAGTTLTVRGDNRRQRVGGVDLPEAANADPNFGTNMDLRGTFDAGNGDRAIKFHGHTDVDLITFNETFLQADAAAYGSQNTSATLANDGEDEFLVNQLQTMNVAGGETLTLDGQADTDKYRILTTGTHGAERNYIINVLDTGAKNDGIDDLGIFGVNSTLNGPDDPTDDIFLLRRTSFIPNAQVAGNEVADTPAFVALLHGTLDQARTPSANDAVRPQEVQRVNYDANVNGRMTVYGLGGNDAFISDDNAAVTTLDGGAGNDQFQIGQIFGTQRNEILGGLAPSDIFDTIGTTRGYLSRGNTAPIVAQGGTGDDSFTVYSNQAELRLEGDAGNDLFTVRAFALAETNPDGTIQVGGDGVAIPKLTGSSTAGQTNVLPGEGDDQIQYNVNAPVSIDGGTGFDKVLVLGTEFADNFVISEDGIFGAGVTVRYDNVELIEIDGLEGDDDFFVISTPFGVVTRLVGGLGSDTFNVMGDVTDRIVTRELEGGNGIINHQVTSSTDAGYDGLLAPGIDLNVTMPKQGVIAIEETNGSTTIREGALSNVDPYTVRLTQPVAPGTRVYVTVTASRSGEEEAAAGGDTMLVSTDPGLFTRGVPVNGVTETVRNRAIVLTFDENNWMVPQTVYVRAAEDNLAEGSRVVTMNHAVSAQIMTPAAPGDTAAVAAQQTTFATYNLVAVRNVEVTILDDDAAGLIVTESDGGTLVLEGNAVQGIQDTYNVQLAKAPAPGTTVTVKLAFDAAQISLSQSTVVFDSTNWNTPVAITVSATDDAKREDRKVSVITQTIDKTVAGRDTSFDNVVSQLDVEVLDNDTPGVLVRESNGSTLVSKDGTTITDTYTVRLTSAPVGAVTIAVVTGGQTTATPTPLTFDASNWWIDQTVTVKGNPSFVPQPGTEDVKEFSAQPHTLSSLRGPLEIEGGVVGPRALLQAVILPGELNGPLLQIGVQPDKKGQIDTLNVFDDSSLEDKVGTLTGTHLSGLEMAGDLVFPNGTAFGEPAIFAGGPDKDESLVNASVRGRVMVIQQRAARFTLRAGKRTAIVTKLP